MPRDILLAAIVGAHGLKGEVRVKSFSRNPETLGSYGPLHDEAGHSFTLKSQRAGSKGEWIARFAEISDRNAAEAAKGVKLYVPRGALPETSGEEYYHADLIGLSAVDTNGVIVGKVVAVHNFGAGDILEISGEGHEMLISFTRDTVPKIDLAQGRLTVIEPQVTSAGETVGPDADPA